MCYLPCDSVNSMCDRAHVFLVQMLLPPHGWIGCYWNFVFFCTEYYFSSNVDQQRVLQAISVHSCAV